MLFSLYGGLDLFKTAVKIRTWDKSCRTAAFFFCRRPADCSVIKGLMFLDILKTIYK